MKSYEYLELVMKELIGYIKDLEPLTEMNIY